MSSLQDFGTGCPQVHGLSPMASACRRFAASGNITKLNVEGNSIVQVEIIRKDRVNMWSASVQEVRWSKFAGLR